MDPRYNGLKNKAHYQVGRIVAAFFEVDGADRVKVHGPYVCDVTKQGHYLSGSAGQFQIDSLDTYDEASGLLHRTERGPAQGILSFGPLLPKESAVDAMERLAPPRLPDIQGLWNDLKVRERAQAIQVEESLRAGFAQNLEDLGIAPDAVMIGDAPFRR